MGGAKGPLILPLCKNQRLVEAWEGKRGVLEREEEEGGEASGSPG